jgi:hypothetical protein
LNRHTTYESDRETFAREARRRLAVSASFRPAKVHSSRRVRDANESLLLIAAARRGWQEAVRRGEIREVGRNRVELRW